MESMGQFILSDMSRKALTGVPGPSNKLPAPTKWLGHCVVAAPFEAHTSLNFTGTPGSVSGIYYSLFFQIGKSLIKALEIDGFTHFVHGYILFVHFPTPLLRKATLP